MVFLRILSGASSASLDDTVCKSIDGTVIIISGCDGCGKNAEGRLRYFFKSRQVENMEKESRFLMVIVTEKENSLMTFEDAFQKNQGAFVGDNEVNQ